MQFFQHKRLYIFPSAKCSQRYSNRISLQKIIIPVKSCLLQDPRVWTVAIEHTVIHFLRMQIWLFCCLERAHKILICWLQQLLTHWSFPTVILPPASYMKFTEPVRRIPLFEIQVKCCSIHVLCCCRQK